VWDGAVDVLVDNEWTNFGYLFTSDFSGVS
jgi:hypothetical protein